MMLKFSLYDISNIMLEIDNKNRKTFQKQQQKISLNSGHGFAQR